MTGGKKVFISTTFFINFGLKQYKSAHLSGKLHERFEKINEIVLL